MPYQHFNQVLRSTLTFFCCFFLLIAQAQPVTGVWHGKIKKGGKIAGRNTQLELKLIRNGDSLTGTSYYYDGKNVTVPSFGLKYPFT